MMTKLVTGISVLLMSLGTVLAEPEMETSAKDTDIRNFKVDVEKVEEQLKGFGKNVELDGFEGQVIVINSNDNNPFNNYVVSLKDQAGVPTYLVGVNGESEVQLISGSKPATATFNIKKNKKVMDAKTIDNVQFWKVDELVSTGIILNVYKSTLTAALKVNVKTKDGEIYDTANFTNQMKSDSNLVDGLDISAQIFYVKNVPLGTTKSVDFDLDTDNYDLSLVKDKEVVDHIHFKVGSVGIKKIVFNSEAKTAQKEARD